MKNQNILTIVFIIVIIALAGLACRAQVSLPETVSPTIAIPAPKDTPTALPAIPAPPGTSNPDEPTAVFGNIPYTSPFFLNSTSEPFVMLEDEAGFVQRDRDYEFPLEGQAIGPVIKHEDQTMTYELSLPSIPQASYVDVDNNGQKDLGVQVFAIAYWDNTWGGPFLEERDGTGWSSAYTSTKIDSENEDEIIGGTLLVWAPDDQQSFPTGFGADGLLFTADDPTAPIPAGYNIIDLDTQPFQVTKEARPEINLIEGAGEVNDYSELSYSQAFDALFQKSTREYPFSVEKNINWQALYDQFKPRFDQVKNSDDFFSALRDFVYSIPDGHVGLGGNDEAFSKLFVEESGGGFGMVLTELSDKRVLVKQVIPDYPANQAGILPGAELIEWDGKSIQGALDGVIPNLGSSYSTPQARRAHQLVFLPRVPIGGRVAVVFKNPGESKMQTIRLKSIPEFDSLWAALNLDETDPLLPIEAEILQPSGLGYIRISTFNDNYHLMAQLWERYIQEFIDQDVPGIVLDLRENGGGNSGLANNFLGYFYDETIKVYRRSYYNERAGDFVYSPETSEVEPAPLLFEGPIAILVSQDCVSACEGFSYILQNTSRGFVVGHNATAGAFGDVGLGQYKLPDGITLQAPTGRAEDLDGNVIIEGNGVIPDILVPITENTVFDPQDTVLQAAIQAILEKID